MSNINKLPAPEVTSDRQINAISSSVTSMNARFNTIPFLNGNQVSGTVFAATTDTPVNHGLGRGVRGWLVLRSYGANSARLKEGSTQGDLTKQLVLYADAACTVDLWFF